MWPRRRWSRRMPKLRLEQCLWRGQANMKFNFVKANKWKAANAAGGASAARSDVQHFSVPSSMMSTTMKPANCSLHFIWPEITGFHIKNTYWTTRQTHAQLSSDQSRPKQTGADRRNIGRASLSDIRQRCCCCWCRSRFWLLLLLFVLLLMLLWISFWLFYSCRWHHFTSFITIMTRLTGAEPKADNATGKLDKETAGQTGQAGQPGQMDRELNV